MKNAARLRFQVLGLGAALTGVTGLLCAVFPTWPLWAPGLMAAFVINGGAHEDRFGRTMFWVIAAAANFVAYSLASWLALQPLRRILQRPRR